MIRFQSCAFNRTQLPAWLFLLVFCVIASPTLDVCAQGAGLSGLPQAAAVQPVPGLSASYPVETGTSTSLISPVPFPPYTGLRPVRESDSDWKIIKEEIERTEATDPESPLGRRFECVGRIEGKAIQELFPKWEFYALAYRYYVRKGFENRSWHNPGSAEYTLAVAPESEEIVRAYRIGQPDDYGGLLKKINAGIRDADDVRLVWDAFCEIHVPYSHNHKTEMVSENEWKLGIGSFDQTIASVDGVETIVTHTHFTKMTTDPTSKRITGWKNIVETSDKRFVRMDTPQPTAAQPIAPPHETAHPVPHLFWALPFVLLLLCIAIFPLMPLTGHWWEKNSSKLIVSMILAAATGLYYLLRGHGFHGTPAGIPTLLSMLRHAVIGDYIPFIVLLFSLYTISGGINFKGDIPAHPFTNTLFLVVGSLLASVIGTTGTAMLLIRPLLQINSERKHVKHTVVFFIFLVCNIGGCLLPIGDPPLFLGYLRGVPFLWTLNLVKEWAVCTLLVLLVYYVWETIAYRTEAPQDLKKDEETRIPIALSGKRNFLFLAGVVLAVALLVPDKGFLGTAWKIPPNLYLREIVLLGLAVASLAWTPKGVHEDNGFNFHAINEVACLFIGIFITMQVPIEILQLKGGELGLTKPWQFFWASGILSSFLDNAPTYVVYFSTATTLDPGNMSVMQVLVAGVPAHIPIPLLAAVSCGSVFMGANTYIGNGPNFMVKSIAERSGVKMPSFFGYMVYSTLILIPIFLLMTFLFFRS